MPGQLLVSDANILIDMDAGGQLKGMFKLDYGFAVPDVLFEEELKAQLTPRDRSRRRRGRDCGGERRRRPSPPSPWPRTAFRGGPGRRGAGRNDLLALALASQEKCPLLTGDSRLRKVCEDQKMDVHGTIWLVGQMIEQKIVGIAAARSAYRAMREARRRLPWDEVEKQLESFRK